MLSPSFTPFSWVCLQKIAKHNRKCLYPKAKAAMRIREHQMQTVACECCVRDGCMCVCYLGTVRVVVCGVCVCVCDAYDTWRARPRVCVGRIHVKCKHEKEMRRKASDIRFESVACRDIMKKCLGGEWMVGDGGRTIFYWTRCAQWMRGERRWIVARAELSKTDKIELCHEEPKPRPHFPIIFFLIVFHGFCGLGTNR